jgi:hypothetical protein
MRGAVGALWGRCGGAVGALWGRGGGAVGACQRLICAALNTQVRSAVHEALGRHYCSVLVNYYPGGGSGMRFHADPGQGEVRGWGCSPMCLGCNPMYPSCSLMHPDCNRMHPGGRLGCLHRCGLCGGDAPVRLPTGG